MSSDVCGVGSVPATERLTTSNQIRNRTEKTERAGHKLDSFLTTSLRLLQRLERTLTLRHHDAMTRSPHEIEAATRCPYCRRYAPQQWLIALRQPHVTWSVCSNCRAIAIWEQGILRHPASLADILLPPSVTNAAIHLGGQMLDRYVQQLQHLTNAAVEATHAHRARAVFIQRLRRYLVLQAERLPSVESPIQPPSDEFLLPIDAFDEVAGVVSGSDSPATAHGTQEGIMMEHSVLDLAVSDQKAAEGKIEELRLEIALEEERLAEIAVFLETYRSYEARVAPAAASSASSTPPTSSSSWQSAD